MKHVIALGSALKQAQARAVQLIDKLVATPTSPPVDNPPPSKPPVTPTPTQPASTDKPHGKRVVKEDTAVNLSIEEAEDLIVELKESITAAQTISLSLSWIIEEGETD